MVKSLIFAVIVLVIPLFFALIFLNSSRNRLSALRQKNGATAARLFDEYAARRRFIPKVVDALLPVMPDERLLVDSVRTACKAAETAASTMAEQPREAMPSLLVAAESGLEVAMKKLVALAQSSAEVRAHAELLRLIDDFASANQRVDAARRQWEESEALQARRPTLP